MNLKEEVFGYLVDIEEISRLKLLENLRLRNFSKI